LPGAEALGELPWVFRPERPGDEDRWRWVGRGAVADPSSTLLVALPPDGDIAESVDADDTGAQVLGRALWRVRGRLVWAHPVDGQATIRAGRQEDTPSCALFGPTIAPGVWSGPPQPTWRDGALRELRLEIRDGEQWRPARADAGTFRGRARHSGELTMFWKDDQGATLTASKTITVG
jgi:hypothetical protein